ncbi:MAG: hypothetical protein ACYC7L_06290 [Nitrospirota bacterium]
MRRAGTAVILYVFMHSYFGVGSFRNALGEAPFGPVQTLALLFALCWSALLAAGVLLVLKKAGGARLGQAAAGGWTVLAMIETFYSLPGNGEAFTLIFVASRSVFPLFLTVVLPAMIRPDDGSPVPGRRYSLVIAGALLPWIAAGAVQALPGPSAVTRMPGAFLSLFVSLWCAIPFAVLVLMADLLSKHPERRYLFWGGSAGAGAASLYVYGLIWAQGFNSFLLALLGPVVFAGEAIGMAVGMFLEGTHGKRDR